MGENALKRSPSNRLQGAMEEKIEVLRKSTQGDDDSDREDDDTWENEEDDAESKPQPFISQNSSEEASEESSCTTSENPNEIQITGPDDVSFEKSKQESNATNPNPGDFKSQLQQQFRKRGIQVEE